MRAAKASVAIAKREEDGAIRLAIAMSLQQDDEDKTRNSSFEDALTPIGNIVDRQLHVEIGSFLPPVERSQAATVPGAECEISVTTIVI